MYGLYNGAAVQCEQKAGSAWAFDGAMDGWPSKQLAFFTEYIIYVGE